MSFHDFREYSQYIVQQAADLWITESDECVLRKSWLVRDSSDNGERFTLKVKDDHGDVGSLHLHVDWLLSGIVISIESPAWLLVDRFPSYFKHIKGKLVHTWTASIKLEELWRQIRNFHELRDEAMIMDVYKAIKVVYRLIECNVLWTEVGLTHSGLKKVHQGDTEKLDWNLPDDRGFIQSVRDTMSSPVLKGSSGGAYAYFWSDYVSDAWRALLSETYA